MGAPDSVNLEMEVVSWADGTPTGTISLSPSVFGVPVRRDVVHDVVRWQLAKRRSGNGQVCAARRDDRSCGNRV